jgi:hypothetical protein
VGRGVTWPIEAVDGDSDSDADSDSESDRDADSDGNSDSDSLFPVAVRNILSQPS